MRRNSNRLSQLSGIHRMMARLAGYNTNAATTNRISGRNSVAHWYGFTPLVYQNA
jgi:hypothetical protein